MSRGQFRECADDLSTAIDKLGFREAYAYGNRGIVCWRLARDEGPQHPSYPHWIALAKSDLAIALKGRPGYETYVNVLRAVEAMSSGSAPAAAAREGGSEGTPTIHDQIITLFRNRFGQEPNELDRLVACLDLDDANRAQFASWVAHYYQERKDEVALAAWTNHLWANLLPRTTPAWTKSVVLTTKRIYGYGCVNPKKRAGVGYVAGLRNAAYAYEYASLTGPMVVSRWPNETLCIGSDIEIDMENMSKKGREAIRDFLEQACALWKAHLSS
jgi:hypothetical protein